MSLKLFFKYSYLGINNIKYFSHFLFHKGNADAKQVLNNYLGTI